MSKAIVVSGVGLGSDEDWLGLFRDLDYEAISLELQDFKTSFQEELEGAEVIVLKGPWTATPEERLYALVLAFKMEQLFKEVKQLWVAQKKAPRILALGRGALAVLSSSVFWQTPILSSVEWKRQFVGHGPWLKLDWISDNPELKSDLGVRYNSELSRENENAIGQTLAFGGVANSKKQKLKEFVKPMALLQGRALPEIQSARIKELQKWLSSEGVELGWKSYEKKLCFSLVDILAYSDRTQNQNFGYSDLSQQPTRLQILEHFLKEG